MESSNYRRETDEAIRAGQQARGSLLQAKDCFLEDFPTDWLVQTKHRIQDAEREADDAIELVEKILRQLESL